MVNHCRTLLLNSARMLDNTIPGEEYVPSLYVPVTNLPAAVVKVRKLVFGDSPDRIMLNYRLRQLMPLWHDTELEADVQGFDPRITYWPAGRTEFYRDAFVPRITSQHGGPLTLLGEHEPDENAGRLESRWQVARTGSTTVHVSQLLPPYRGTPQTVSFTGNLSSQFQLTGSSLYATIEGPVGATWFITAIARPQRSMGDICATLQSFVTGTDELTLFDSSIATTWRELWRDHPWYGYKLGALMLAVANTINGRR